MSNFEENKKSVAKEISKFRMQKEMTIEDLAEKVGISTTALSNILKGKANLKTSTLIAICVALEVFPGEILPTPSFYNKWEMRVEKVNHKLADVPASSKEKALGLVLAVLDAFIKTKVGGGYVVQVREEEQEGATQSNVVKDNKKYIANRIEMTIVHKGLAIRELASIAEMSEGTLNNIVQGRSDMRMSSLIDLCEALAVFPEEILPQFAFGGKGTKRFECVKNKLMAIPAGLKETAFLAVEAILDEYKLVF